MARGVWILVLTMMGTSLAGCMDDAREAGDDGAAPATPTSPTTSGRGDAPAGGTEPASTTGRNGDEEIAPPSEQHEEDCRDVDRAGEWCERPWTARSDRKSAAPLWRAGNRWRYEVEVPLAAASMKCNMEHEDQVTGTGSSAGLAVYALDRIQFDHKECDGSVLRESPINYTRSDLLLVRDDGYIEHEFVFPLEDGKRWMYRIAGNATVEAELRFVPGYRHGLSFVDAWQVSLLYSRNGIEVYKWFGEAAKHRLYEEMWADVDGVKTLVSKVTLTSSKV